MRYCQLFALALIGLAMPASAQEARRQLGAHTHGVGQLSIAIEGNRVEMELEAPAHDILGFEHEPTNDEQKKILVDARERLAGIAGIFALTPEAQCTLKSSDVDVLGAAGGGADHDHDHEKSTGGDKADAHHEDHEHGAHSAFRVTYQVVCASPSKLGTMAFDYFKAFKGAQKLNVTVIGPKGQSSYEVTREAPVLDLSGVS